MFAFLLELADMIVGVLDGDLGSFGCLLVLDDVEEESRWDDAADVLLGCVFRQLGCHHGSHGIDWFW